MIYLLFSLYFTAAFSQAAFFSVSAIKDSYNPQTEHHRDVLSNYSIPAGEDWIVLLGDSGITGAASDPELFATGPNLLGKAANFLFQSERTDNPPKFENFIDPDFFHVENPVLPLTRVSYSTQEFRAAEAQGTYATGKINIEAKGGMQVDVEEYSFGYLIGRYLQIPAKNIVLVGHDGSRVKTIPTQFQRIYEVSESLPPRMIISFTANDLCGTAVLENTVEQQKQNFKTDLRSQLTKVITDGQVLPEGGTDVYVIAPLNFMEILTSTSISSKIIPFGAYSSKDITCKDIRTSNLEGTDLKALKGLQNICKSVLRTNINDTKRVDFLKQIYLAHIEAWREVLAEIQPLSPVGLRWHFVDAPKDMSFTGDDVANDCFHPSAHGHAKIAKVILKAIQ